jgi:uncharacterized protein (DUF1330 family)
MSAPTYLIAQIDVKDLARYRAEYGKAVAAQLPQFGAELLVGSSAFDALEGQWPGNWTVVIRFPSREAALAWYDSRDYEPLKALRISELTAGANLILVAGRDDGSGPGAGA